MSKRSIDMLLLVDSKTWSCLSTITPASLKQEIESLMGGYHIMRDCIDEDTTLYSGDFSSRNWFDAIFRMHGFKINITIQ